MQQIQVRPLIACSRLNPLVSGLNYITLELFSNLISLCLAIYAKLAIQFNLLDPCAKGTLLLL